MAKITDYVRVTEVLGDFSGLKRIDPYILRNAAERGTKVHELCTAIMDDIGTSPFEPKLEGYIQSFSKWKEDKNFIERPSRLYCDKYMITGEVDGIYKENGKLVLFDIKTSANENPTWCLQGSAYSYLCKNNGYDVSRIEFIKLSKDGKDAKVYEYKENFELFLKCLDLYKIFFKNIKEENLLEYL